MVVIVMLPMTAAELPPVPPDELDDVPDELDDELDDPPDELDDAPLVELDPPQAARVAVKLKRVIIR